MPKDLIIVESPAKVKTIKKFLGRDFQVEASVGHVRDLPKNDLGVDEKRGFSPAYEVIPGKQKVVSALKSAAATARNVYLAPDPDREGEAIAWHVAELIKDKNANLSRISFNEITPRAVKEALANPRPLNENLFHSQQARRILDRLVGYKISPLLWQKVKRGISAGRVQSVALKLIVDRERERQAFTPEEYWPFKALLAADAPPKFEVELWKLAGKKARIGDADSAEALDAALKQAAFSVLSVEEKERKKSPAPPFITSTLQQESNRKLGFSAKKTMGAAQKLYEGVDLGERGTTALITYMRTDSPRISEDARDAAKEFILSTWGEDHYPATARRFKGKQAAQDAHEAVRPVDPAITPASVAAFLPRDQFKLYKLIWERFIASQMAPAVFHDTLVTVVAPAGEQESLWRAKGERLLFPGYLKAYGVGVPKAEEAEEGGQPGEPGDTDEAPVVDSLPPLAAGQKLTLLAVKKEQKFTLPPPRFTEASLVKELEEKGIGRPSTYAAIISTLLDRDYAHLEEKKFAPTELGSTVSDLLGAHFATLMDSGFTSAMEESLDKVAEGQTDWVDLLTRFTGDFYPTLAQAKESMKQLKAGMQTDITCELCGKPMSIRFGKNGEFLGCSGYPACKNIKNFTRGEKGEIIVQDKVEAPKTVVGTCPECGKELVVKQARTGSRFIACTGWPDCKHTEPFSTGVPCPQCDGKGELVEKSSKRGKVFYSCSTYPKCDYATWDWPVNEPCPQCDSKILTKKKGRGGEESIVCPKRGCGYRKKVGGEEEE